MKKFLNTKTVLGSLVIGIFGSALWDTVFKDLFNFVGKTLLTISTLGLEKYKNDIYINIAKGFYEQVSIQTLSLGLGILFGITIGSMLVILRTKEKDENTKETKITEWLKKNKYFIRTGFLFYVIFVMSITLLSVTKNIYINRSIAYYQQLKSISAPYLTPEKEEIFNSRFAQIRNKEDYITLITELTIIINESGQKLPDSPSFIF